MPDRGEIHVKARRRESLRVRVREGKPGFRCRWCGNRGGLCPGGDRHAREHAIGSAQMGRRGRQRCPCGSHGQGCGVAAASAGEAVTNLLGPGGPDASGGQHIGLPWAGCTVLAADSSSLAEVRERANGERRRACRRHAALAQTNRSTTSTWPNLSRRNPRIWPSVPSASSGPHQGWQARHKARSVDPTVAPAVTASGIAPWAVRRSP